MLCPSVSMHVSEDVCMCLLVCVCASMTGANKCKWTKARVCCCKKRLHNFSRLQQKKLVSLSWSLCQFWADGLFCTDSSFEDQRLEGVVPTWDMGSAGRGKKIWQKCDGLQCFNLGVTCVSCIHISLAKLILSERYRMFWTNNRILSTECIEWKQT